MACGLRRDWAMLTASIRGWAARPFVLKPLPVGGEVCAADGGVVLRLQPLAVLVGDVWLHVLHKLTERLQFAFGVHEVRGYFALHIEYPEYREYGSVVCKCVDKGVGCLAGALSCNALINRTTKYFFRLFKERRLYVWRAVAVFLLVYVHQCLGDGVGIE